MSSYDVGVWFSPVALSDAQAADYFSRLGRTIVVVERRPEFDAFLRELTTRFPDRAADAEPVSADAVPAALLRTWDDLQVKSPTRLTPDQIARFQKDGLVFEASPWSGDLAPNGDTMNLPFRWSTADQTIPVVIGMAQRHNLTLFDTEAGKVSNPPGRTAQGAAEFLTVHLTLRLKGQPPAVETTLIQDGQTVLHLISPDRAAAHATARRIALERHQRAYEVSDPRSLAQGTRLVPVPAGSSSLAPILDTLRKEGSDFQILRLEGPNGPVR